MIFIYKIHPSPRHEDIPVVTGLHEKIIHQSLTRIKNQVLNLKTIDIYY